MAGRNPKQTPPAAGSGAAEVVTAYLKAMAASDFTCARACLADQGFSNRSPISRFDNADAFIADISRIGAILERVEVRKIFVDGDEVCVIANYVTHMQRRQETPVLHWMQVAGGRIRSIETLFDARVYEDLFELAPDPNHR